MILTSYRTNDLVSVAFCVYLGWLVLLQERDGFTELIVANPSVAR